MQQIFIWWLLASVLGWVTFPISFWLFPRLADRGYTFSRALGLLAASYLLWLGASLGVLQNNLGGIALSLLILLAASAWLALRPGGSQAQLREFFGSRWALILTAELLFLACLVGWAVVRAYAVGKIMNVGGEKFMEMAFLNGILQSTQFPPLDPWLSGYSISYYYFGYVMMALLTQVSGAAASVAFDLYDALLFALITLGAFGLVYNMTAARPAARGAIPAGLLGGLLTTVMGNLQGLLESLYSRGWLPVRFADWLAVPDFPAQAQVTGTFDPGSFWGWGWRASRVINDLDLSGQPLGLKPITEFPNFSLLLGDNHPHLLGLPFALLAAGVAFHLLLSTSEGVPTLKADRLRIVLFAWIIGSLIFLNTWDYPIYLGLALLAWAVGRSAATGRLGIQMVLWAVLLYGLFLIGFSSQAGGVLPYIFPPTRLPQYLVMFGPFIFILAVFLLASFRQQNLEAGQPISSRDLIGAWLRLAGGLTLLYLLVLALTGLALWLDARRGGDLAAGLSSYLGGQTLAGAAGLILAQRLANPWLFLLLTSLLLFAGAGIYQTMRAQRKSGLSGETVPGPTLPVEPGLLFARLAALVGLALTFSVEFFYLRDGFGVRMNTVFKFYFQGWVLMACASAFALWWLASLKAHTTGRILRAASLSGAAVLVLGGLVYPVLGVYSRTNAFSTPPNLDGASELRRDHPDDWAAIDWLSAHGRTGPQPPLLLEAPGTSYTYAGRMSAFTGFPTLLGWAGHELQWRGSYTIQAQREPLIRQTYTTPDPSTALQLLVANQVDYVILGETERDYIRTQCSQPEQPCNPNLAEEKFKRILSPVFQQGQTAVYAVPRP